MVGGRESPGGGRAVSDVVAVVLVAAITIVLAAMVGTVVLDLVTEIEASPIAASSTEFDAANDSVSVTYTSTQNPNTVLNATLYNATSGARVGTETVSTVGGRATFGGLDDGTAYRLVVAAEAEGRRSVLAEQTARV